MIIGFVLSAILMLGPPQDSACADLASCRQAALDAAAQNNFESFHDLAWRALQKGRPNDPDLMALVARAQSLSGRPGDALVMLRRIAEIGAVPDGVDGDDFRRVRALDGWPALESLIIAAKEKRAPVPAAESKPSPRSAPTPARTTTTTTTTAATTASVDEPIHLPAPEMEAIGIAYDSASRRFVVADRHENKLIVADEVFKRVNDLIGAGSGGFGTLTALEIDRRRGDLWVTSSGESGMAVVHKLQLVSGRVLSRLELPDTLHPARFTDVAVTDAGALLLIDGTGSRLLTLPAAAREFARPVRLGVSAPTSLASAGGGVVYVAHDGGLAVVDLQAGTVEAVRAASGVVLTGLNRIRWHRGALVAIQTVADSARLVRLQLARSGKSVSTVETIDDQIPEKGSALTVSGDAAYYLAHAENGPIIRRVALR